MREIILMSLNLFFVLIIIVSIICISIPNSILDTSNCTRHWVALITIISGIIGMRGHVEIAFIFLTTLGLVVCSVLIHRHLKSINHIGIVIAKDTQRNNKINL